MPTLDFRAHCADIVNIQYPPTASGIAHVDVTYLCGTRTSFSAGNQHLTLRQHDPVVVITAKKRDRILPMYVELVAVARNKDALCWINTPDSLEVQDACGRLQPQQQERLLKFAVAFAAETRELPVSKEARLRSADF